MDPKAVILSFAVILVIILSNFRATRWISVLLPKTGKIYLGDPPANLGGTMISGSAEEM